MKWLQQYAKASKGTDKIYTKPNYAELLALGLMGEAGSMLAELKKERREGRAYPAYRHRLTEECGDFLWYLIRLVDELDPELLLKLRMSAGRPSKNVDTSTRLFLEFGDAVGKVLAGVQHRRESPEVLRPVFSEAWRLLVEICREKRLNLAAAAQENIKKAQSRWPKKAVYCDFFDDGLDEEEQLPRDMEIEFRDQPDRKSVVLRCGGLNFGDRLTDNIRDEDGSGPLSSTSRRWLSPA